MEKHNPLGDKENAPAPRHRDDRARPAKPPTRPKQSEGRPAGPGERSDEESIGRPVQLEEPAVKHRPGAPEERGSEGRGV
jgi:hypothetical protein